MYPDTLPDTDLSIKWQNIGEGLTRRDLNFRKERAVLPSLEGAIDRYRGNTSHKQIQHF